MNKTIKKTQSKNEGLYSAGLYSLKMVREESIDFISTQTITSDQVSDFIMSFYKNKGYDREVTTVIALDNSCNVIGIHVAHIGTLDSCRVHPREVFKFAILSNAKFIILAHNHPTGKPIPSPADIILTSKLARAGKYLSIEVVDHLIIGDENYTSLRETSEYVFNALSED